jgi:hypothetical protein
MRVHISSQVQKLRYQLGEAGNELRQALESLKTNPTPEWARKVEEYESRYEFFMAGYWVIYEIKQDRGETVIVVSAMEETI